MSAFLLVPAPKPAGVGEPISLIAPPGMFRVISIQPFDDEELEGDFESLELAHSYVSKHTDGSETLKMDIYDDTGKHVGGNGLF